MGLGEDADSDAILGAVTKIIDGEYYPSRVYGVPGYEFIAALLYKYNGIVMVNLYSFILYVLYVFIVFKIIREFFENNGFYIFIAMCFHPVVLLNATVMMETMQIVALASLAILYYLRLFSCQRKNHIHILSVICAAMIFTKPDAVFFVLSMFVSLMLSDRLEMFRRTLLLVGAGAALFLFLLYFMLFNMYDVSFPVMPSALVFDLKKILRMMIGFANVYGFIAFPLFVLMPILRNKKITTMPYWEGITENPVTSLFVVVTVVYTVRWILLPDEPEYILLPFIAYGLFAINNIPIWINQLFSFSILVMNFMIPSFFIKQNVNENKKLGSYEYRFKININSGILDQEYKYRSSKMYLSTAKFKKDLEKALLVRVDSVYTEPFLPGFIVNNDLFVTSKVGYWQVDLYDLAYSYKNIFVCNEDIIPNRGWRVSQPAIFFDNENSDLNCKKI